MLSKDKTGADIDSKKGSNTDRNKKSRIAIVLTVIGVLVLIALVVLIIIIAKQGKDQGESGRNVGTALSRNIVITPDNADEMIAQLKSEDFVQPGYYCVEMNTTWQNTWQTSSAGQRSMRSSQAASSASATFFQPVTQASTVLSMRSTMR